MTEHVLVLAATDCAALGAVRAVPDLRAAGADGRVWLRGLPAAAPLPLVVRTLPIVAAYTLDVAGRLFPVGRTTPVGTLPALAWQPIQEFAPLAVSSAALPAQAPPRYSVQLVPSDRAAASAALLTSWASWHAYAETAPEIRLRALRFAVSAEQLVLVLGTPLPPLPGQEYWQQQNLLLPAGFDLEASLLAPLLIRQLTPENDAFVLFAPDGSWERVLTVHLLPVTRSAVRLTAASFSHE
ncbi:hypothetical protein F1C16_06025 [Hymenobacter sp. NBH84]|uniref:MoxR-vWA-beta-propeller ternary system domain-containing protein n=1 Tax=Hymenobacter defluvii TaxID=2054411 RepID=A0ABS3T746_9BACT|nr:MULTISPECIES: hypothetical protein [Hymenobacter]MBO3269469.1 hypothetical protein [Hymenobacter defluvii]QNE39142.1 hypothetical protein F1C16_06025 [Hymenobacter sp. NBH84]